MKFKLITPGSFFMGSDSSEAFDDEKPVHNVKITKAYYIGIHPVTQEQYELVMSNNPSHFQGYNRPVDSVTWEDAVEYCRRLSEIEGIKCRLPTEAEWEYAARAGTTTQYYWGNKVDGSYCWFAENSFNKTHTVGTKKPNPWGLHDMAGNIWEWCSDWYDEEYYSKSPQSDPKGPASGEERVLRGGSWYFDRVFMRATVRGRVMPGNRGSSSGFRCARDVSFS